MLSCSFCCVANFSVLLAGRSFRWAPSQICLVLLQAVGAWCAGGTAAVAWGWDPGPAQLVRGWQYAAHGWQFDVLSRGAGRTV